jgi:DNA-binding CsgD family transcriptional regulator
MQRGKIHPAFVSSSIDFTHDEIKILNLISKEQTNQQIADTMCKSIRTIEKHKTRMMEKVGAQNNVGLVLYAIKHKIIEI